MTLDFFGQFNRNVDAGPSRVALQGLGDEGREAFTYDQVAREAAAISLFLERSGIRPGDAVGLLMENHPRWGISFLGAQSAGAVLVPLDILHTAETLAGFIRHAECRYLIVSEKLLPLCEEIQRRLPSPVPVLVPDQTEAAPDMSLPLVRRSLDDDLIILYTSGTTGNPKAIVLTQRNVYRNVVEILRIIRVSPEDHMLSVLPLYHVLALMTNFIIPLYMGGTVTYLPALEAQRILAAFREEGITIFVCVPQFYYLLHRRIKQEVARQGLLKRLAFRGLLRLSRAANMRLGWNPGKHLFPAVHRIFGGRLRILGVGGARFDRRIAEDFRDLGFNLVQAYGLSETAALVTVAPPDAHSVGSIGRPLPHCEIRIDQPDENGIGEILIRGDNVMRGYWKNPEATGEAIRDGWFHSGDLGCADARGNLHITGRKKDVIVLSSGKNIFPEEVEHFYQSNCPLIKEMCVLGRKDPSSGTGEEQLHAVIVPDFDHLRAREIVNVQDAVRWRLETVSQKIPPYKRVRTFQIQAEPLPRTTTRKLKRFQLEQEIARQESRKQEPREAIDSAPGTAEEQRLLDLVRRIKPEAPFGRTLNLELDLGFSSLERVELLQSVREAFGVALSNEDAAKIHTIGDLLSAVEGGSSADTQAGAGVSWAEMLDAPLDPDDERRVRQILTRRRFYEFFYFVCAKGIRLLFLVLLRLRFRGRQHLPREYPYLICPNHVSYLDAFLVFSGLPYRVLSRMFILGERAYFSNAFAALIGRIAKVIPINADRGPRQSLRLAAEGLRRGLVLCVFPEGERSIDGSLKPFRLGPAILAAILGVPAVPVCLQGAWEVWPRGTNKIRLHPVTVTFGRPIRPEDGERPADFNDRLMQAVRDLPPLCNPPASVR